MWLIYLFISFNQFIFALFDIQGKANFFISASYCMKLSSQALKQNPNNQFTYTFRIQFLSIFQNEKNLYTLIVLTSFEFDKT